MAKEQIFTADELQAMRDSLTELRTPGAYEEGRWMVSALNRDPGVVGPLPASVTIRDISLRTIDQMRGVVLGPERRRRLLTSIVESGVAEIQLSMFGRGYSIDDMRDEIAAVKRINPDCLVIYTGAATVEHIEIAAQAGIDIVQAGTTPVAGLAPVRMGGAFKHAWEGRDWREHVPRSTESRMDRMRELIKASQGTSVQISCAVNQLAYASEEWVAEFSAVVGKEGCERILLADGSSGCGPEAFARMSTIAKTESGGAHVLVHPHNAFNLANAIAIASVRGGADGVEVSLNGYCSGAGQADFAHVVLSFEALYGVHTGVDLSTLTPLARLAEELTGQHLPENYPVTGREVFNLGGSDGIVAQLDVDQLIHWVVEPTLIGNERRWEITRSSGPYTMWQKLDELGIDVERAEVEPILEASLGLIRELGRPITDAEIVELVRSRSLAASLTTG